MASTCRLLFAPFAFPPPNLVSGEYTMSFLGRSIFTFLFALGFCSSVLAADAPKAEPPKKPQAYTDPTQADADFAVQGEYAGEMKTPAGEARKVGVQVEALGKGKFHAVLYTGGLPGEGWDQKT